MANEVDAVEIVLRWGGIVLGAVATAITSWLFKGKESLKKQLEKNTLDVIALQTNQESDRRLLSQKLSSVENELHDMKTSSKDDLADIKTAVNTLNATVMQLAITTGELSGKIKD